MEMNVQTDLEDVGSWFDLCAERTMVIRGQGRDLRGFTLGVQGHLALRWGVAQSFR